MNLLFDSFTTSNRHPSLPEPGLFHYRKEEGEDKTRVHLRIDPDGRGILIINANRMIQLNPSAAMMSFLLLEGNSDKQTLRKMKRIFKISKTEAQDDLAQFKSQLGELLEPNGACPVCCLLYTSRCV